jgi:carbonic anhydrase
MQKIVQGVCRFRQEIFQQQKEWFEHLANKGQKPEALFITCSDSRINPNLITQTEPGDLFLLRNAGNIVPPYGAANGGEGATIEYAVAVLGIKHIIVCGHSHCGAMSALMQDKGLEELPAVRGWFKHAQATRQIMRRKYQDVTDKDELALLAVKENVLSQLDNLRTHPSVAAGMAHGELHLYGWVYIIETGTILAFDPGLGQYCLLHESVACPIPAPARLNGESLADQFV